MKAKLLVAMFGISVLAIIGLNLDMGWGTQSQISETEVVLDENTEKQIQELRQQVDSVAAKRNELQRLDAEIREKQALEHQQQQFIARQQQSLEELQEIQEMQTLSLSAPVMAIRIPDTVINADGSKTLTASHAMPMEEVVVTEVVYDTIRVPYPVKEEVQERQSHSLSEPQEPQVIVVKIPEEQSTGIDWKSVISWIIAAANGLVLLVINLKKLKS